MYSCEIDKIARKTYEMNFGDIPAGDIKNIAAMDIPDFDVLTAGFPCQPFSVIGNQKGFADETSGTMFYEIERVLKEKQPKAFMLENVKGLLMHDNGNTFNTIIAHLEALGYHVFYKVLNSQDYGIPQHRERIIIVGFLNNINFTFPEPVPNKEKKSLLDILEADVDRSYFVDEAVRQARVAKLKEPDVQKPYISHENLSGYVTPHEYSCALRANASTNYLLINDERRLTEREMLRLQGFPDSFNIVGSYNQAKKQIGNSVTVPLISAVSNRMFKAMNINDI